MRAMSQSDGRHDYLGSAQQLLSRRGCQTTACYLVSDNGMQGEVASVWSHCGHPWQ